MSLLEHLSHSPTVWNGELPVSNRYSFGLAGERFFRGIKEDGKILGSRCPECQVDYVPGASFCERCLAKLDDWFDAGTTGEVYSYTFLYENPDGSRKETPEIIAFIKIGDGGLIHFLREIKPDEVEFGMDVQAVFKPQAEREGSILDIQYFKPVS